MPLQSSGAISMSQINTELGRSSTSGISLDAAENGSYGAINQNSTSRPSSGNPASLSEWYGYNHNASPPVVCDPYGTLIDSYCSGCTYYEVFANGACGTYTETSFDSPICGCGCPSYGTYAQTSCTSDSCIVNNYYHDGNCGIYLGDSFYDCGYCFT